MNIPSDILVSVIIEKDRQIAWLCKEVNRLSRMVKDVERSNDGNCPWCYADQIHLGDCAAFQPDGRLRDMAAERLAEDEAGAAEIAKRLLSGEVLP